MFDYNLVIVEITLFFLLLFFTSFFLSLISLKKLLLVSSKTNVPKTNVFSPFFQIGQEQQK